ncbi:hypothetical protein Tco_0825246, partial [Tanacetum coccineum]
SPFQLEAYSDSDYAGSHGDRKSTTGGCPFLGRRQFSWDCNEQNLIQVLKIHTDDNVADLLTKAFDGLRFEYLVVNTAASCISFLLDALFLLVAMDYADGSVFMLVGILLLVDSFLLIGFVYAVNTSTYAAELFDIAGWLVSATSHLVSAGSLQSCWCGVQVDFHLITFIERMTAIKERKKRALADLRYRALKGKPLKKSEVTQLMRNLVKNQWCAAHNGTITMKDVKAMNQKQLVEEYEYICRRLEKDRLLSAQYNLFRPKPVITEPPSKRQRVERASSQPASVPAATTSYTKNS